MYDWKDWKCNVKTQKKSHISTDNLLFFFPSLIYTPSTLNISCQKLHKRGTRNHHQGQKKHFGFESNFLWLHSYASLPSFVHIIIILFVCPYCYNVLYCMWINRLSCHIKNKKKQKKKFFFCVTFMFKFLHCNFYLTISTNLTPCDTERWDWMWMEFSVIWNELLIGHMHRYRIPMGLCERYYGED